MEATDQPKVRHKSFMYKTSVTWTGDKNGLLTSDGKPSFRVSSPPEFKGEPGVWTSEDLFVASTEVCHMSTFLFLAAKNNLPVISYQSHANGVLEYIDGEYRFTRIVLFPTIVVERSAEEKDVYAMLREAEKHCLVANSVASIVEVNPTIMLQ